MPQNVPQIVRFQSRFVERAMERGGGEFAIAASWERGGLHGAQWTRKMSGLDPQQRQNALGAPAQWCGATLFHYREELRISPFVRKAGSAR